MQPATTCGLENDESVEVLLFDVVDDVDGDECFGVDFGFDLATCRLSSRAM